ncbi:MAG: site-specific integrase [Actinobacteria bacterium]|nr:site-specific integrase [Actinomycetota bacterium]
MGPHPQLTPRPPGDPAAATTARTGPRPTAVKGYPADKQHPRPTTPAGTPNKPITQQAPSPLTAKGLAPQTVAKAAQTVGRILDRAVEDGRLPRSPMRGVPLPRVRPEERRFLSAAEVAGLAGAIEPRFRALVLFMAYTGARIGEAARVKVADLNLLRRTVALPGTKSRAARRTVSLPPFLCDGLAAHLTAFPADEGGLVFTGSEGRPLHLTNFRRRQWKRAVAASVGEPMRPHDLRHSHVALLIAQGEHPKVIQQRLGHTSIKTTLDTYGHLFSGLDEAAADRLEEAGRAALAASRVDTLWTPAARNVVPLPPR